MAKGHRIWLRGGIGDYIVLSMLLHKIIDKYTHVELYLSSPKSSYKVVNSLLTADMQRYTASSKTVKVHDVGYRTSKKWQDMMPAGRVPDTVLSLWDQEKEEVISFEELANVVDVEPDYKHRIPIIARSRLLVSDGSVIFHTDGSSCPGRWDEGAWEGLASYIFKHLTPGQRPVLVGQRGSHYMSNHCIDIRGCSIFDTMLAVKNATCVVCCDSCVKNIAFMLRTPCVVLYDLTHKNAKPIEAWFPKYFQKIDYFDYDNLGASLSSVQAKVKKVVKAYNARLED